MQNLFFTVKSKTVEPVKNTSALLVNMLHMTFFSVKICANLKPVKGAKNWRNNNNKKKQNGV